MDLSARVDAVIRSPSAAFLDSLNHEAIRNGPTTLDACAHKGQHKWRIDGVGAFGTHLLVVPLFLLPHITPLRIDAFVHDEDARVLRSRPRRCELDQILSSVDEENSNIACRVLQALEIWLDAENNLANRLLTSPFGSRILVEGLLKHPSQVQIHLIRDHRIERQMLSVESLQSMWASLVTLGKWPEIIDLENLSLVRQLKDSISLVHFTTNPERGIFVFKSSIWDFRYVYHELKVMLTLPTHPNVMRRPLYVVTKRCCFGGKRGVCGFIIPFFELGSLDHIIPDRASKGTLPLSKRIHWALQITTALLHIMEHAEGYYSDLRFDNILLGLHGESEILVLTDFEQRGNWFAWSPPEVNYIVYIQQLVASEDVPKERKDYYSALLASVSCPTAALGDGEYRSPEFGYNDAWNLLSAKQQESAMVFMLGLMLWCLFEGFGTLSDLPWIRGSIHCKVDFPKFEATPPRLRNVILECTRGAQEHEGRFPEIVRRGNKLFLSDRADASGKEIMSALKAWWHEELDGLERFFKRASHHNQRNNGEAVVFGGEPFFERPALRQVLEALTAEEHELAG